MYYYIRYILRFFRGLLFKRVTFCCQITKGIHSE